MMAMEAMPTREAVKPLAKREADFSARPSVRFGVIRVVSAMLPVSPLYPHEPTSSVRPSMSDKDQEPSAIPRWPLSCSDFRRLELRAFLPQK